MFTLRNKIFSAWSEDVGDSFVDAFKRAHSMVSGFGDKIDDNHDCVVIWHGNKRVAEVRQSRAWTWIHSDYRHFTL